MFYHHCARGDGAEWIHVRGMIEAFIQQGFKATRIFPSASRRELGVAPGLSPFKESNQLATLVKTRSLGSDREGCF